MHSKVVLVLGLCSLFAFQASGVSLPYEVEQTLLRLLNKKQLNDLDTSTRSVMPIYRKDLDPNYIAYYQIDLQGKHFFVLSAGPKTGDYKEAQAGPAPLPTKVLKDQARKAGQVCSKFYLLSYLGLYMCENAQGRAVAATYDWIADAHVADWKTLQRNVLKSLNDFKKEWEKIAASSKGDWKTSERKQGQRKPGLNRYKAEIVTPGSPAEVALERNHGKITIHAIPASRQHELCAILKNVCKGGSTVVNTNLIRKTKSGIKYLKFHVKGDRKNVKKILKDKEISFYFKVETKTASQHILVYFSVDLSLQRSKRWSKFSIWKLKHEAYFPEYDQHKCCGCTTGSGPVAWAQVLGYYDRLAHHSLGFSKSFYTCADESRPWATGCMAPNTMSYKVRKYIQGIRTQLGTYCVSGGGHTPQSRMKNIINWYRGRSLTGRVYYYYHKLGQTLKSIRDRAALYVTQGYPAVVGVVIRRGTKKVMHYAVATRYAVRTLRYRVCSGGSCRNMIAYDKRLYLHMGWGGVSNGWYKVPSAYAAYAAKKY